MTLSSTTYDPEAGQGGLMDNTTSKLAIWAMILGILGLFTGCLGIGVLLGITALVLGLVALGQVGKPGMPGRGKGMAITGVVTGGLSIILVPVMLVAILLPALGAARTTARQMASVTQARGIQQAMLIYAQDQPANRITGHRPMTADIGELFAQDLIDAEHTQSMFDEVDDDLPSDFTSMSPEDQIAWVRVHSDYVLVPNLNDGLDGSEIAVFGKPGRFERGIPVCYNDNSSEWVGEFDIELIDEALKRQTGKTMDQLIREAEAK